jgi:flagellar hook-associated protein 1 FlgK
MTSTFSGLNTALSALYAQRQALDVTGQNIANANTDGYSRQKVTLQSVGGSAVPAMYAVSSNVGGGVAVSGVQRTVDQFLEQQGRTEHAKASYLTTQQGTLANVEQLFNEPSDTGLASQLSDMWANWSDVANNPGDGAARSQLLEQAATVANSLHDAHSALATQWSSGREQLDAVVAQVNTMAANVADLNAAIQRATQAGLPANELSDQRDQLVMNLAEMTGATAKAGDDGIVDVYVGGRALVHATDSETLQVVGGSSLDTATDQPVGLQWSRDNSAALADSGQVAGLVEALNSTLPGYASQLDGVAASLASTVNAGQQAGYDLAGNPGGDFFTGTTAATISVAITDGSQIAASAAPGGNLDGSNATAIAALANGATGPDNTYRTLVVKLGVAAQTSNQRSTTQAAVTSDIDTARQSASGVSLDEEMTNMMMFQRAYEAASRVMTTLDSTLDTLINHTGLVGG